MSESVAPKEILAAFYPNGVEQETVLVGGVINTTLAVKDALGQQSVLQPTSHSLYVPDQRGALWRSFTFRESDGTTPVVNFASCVALSNLLGKLHDSLSRLDYTPRFSLPHFHETTYYADKLESMLPELPGAGVQSLGRQAIDLSRARAIPQEPTQLVHGDPQMANALFRGGVPFTFIDFDTLMKANPLVDVGEMLRAVTEELVTVKLKPTSSDRESVIGAYYEQAKPSLKESEFTLQAINAGQVMALEQSMRFLIDTVEDTYYDWDKENYGSRGAHNVARAWTHWQTFEALHS
jgi:aminoglycoside phosphotransferase (APT) family kinase protein